MKNITGAQGAFIARILIEAYQSKGRRLLEAGFTGQKKDKLGHTRYYQNGRQVKNPNAKEKSAIHAAASQSLPAGQAPSHDDAATRVDALHADTPPEHVAALANDLMKMSVEDLTKMAKGPAITKVSIRDGSGNLAQRFKVENPNGGNMHRLFHSQEEAEEWLKNPKGDKQVSPWTPPPKPPEAPPKEKFDHDSFTETLPPKDRERAKKALEKEVNSGGGLIKRKDLIKEKIKKGYKVTVSQKGERRLQNDQGQFMDEASIGITAMDYAEHLLKPKAAKAPDEAPAVKPTPTETKAAAAAEKATDSGEQKGIGEAGELLSLDTAAIKVDPTRFQYKQKLDSTTGAGDNLKNVSKFNSLFAGVVHAWKDPADGQVYVVNGHHRMELANRAGHKKMNVQMIIAPSASVARSTGALINMAEGRGTALDAAKFLRESGQTVEDIKGHGVSLKEKVVDEAMQLKDLSDRIFNDLSTGLIETDKAVAIGRHLKDHKQQEQLYNHYLEQKDKTNKDFNAATLAQAAIDISRTPTKSGGGQMDLFGNTDEGQSLFLEKAELKTKIRNMLTQEVNDYAMAGNARRAKNIAGAGNILQVDKNKDLSKEADRIKQAYEQFQHLSGPLSDAINASVEEYANAKGSKKPIVEKTLAAVRSAIHEIVDGTNKNDVRASSQNPQDDQGTGGTRQADLPGDIRGGNAQDVGPSLFGEPQDDEAKPADAAKADEPGFTGIDSQGREWRNGELVAAKDKPTAAEPVATPEPAAAVKSMSPEALALDAIRLKSNKKPHNPAHINLEAMGELIAKGFVDAAGKLTDAGREHLYAQKGKAVRKATGPKAAPQAPAQAAPQAAAPAKKAPTGGEKYFGVGGGNVAVTLRNGKKGIIPPPMENVPGWKEYEEQNYPNGPLPPKSFYNLSEAEATEHREAQELIRREWVTFRQDYLAKNGTFDPDSGELVSITLNCDDWRDQFPTYVGTNSGTIHDAASYANMRMLNEAMALMKGKGNNQFLVLGGGGGSGKGTATKDIIKASDYPVVLDSVSDDSAWTKELMDMAKGHGYGGQFVFIDRAPQDAWKDGVVKRAMESREKFNAGDKTSLARTVPLSVALPANLKARRAAFELLEDGTVPTMIINNNLGFGLARKVEAKEAGAYLQTGMNGYNKEQLLKEMEDDTYGLYESGKIPDDIAKGLISARTIAARRLQSRSNGGSDSEGGNNEQNAGTGVGGVQGQAPVDGSTGQGSSSAGKSGQDEVVEDPVERHLKRQLFTGTDAQGREWRNGELVAAKDDEPAAEPTPAPAEPAQAGPAPDDDEPVKSNYFTSNAEIPQWAKDAGYDKRKLKKRGLSQATVESIEDHANQVIRSVATFLDSPEGQANQLKQKLLHQVGIAGGMDSALNSLAHQYRADSQRQHWNPNSGPSAARIAQSLEKLRTDLQSKLNALQHPKAAEPAPAAPAGNTDLFGNPAKATAPKGPETMPGLFGDAVPIAPDAPATAAGEPLPGSDNPLDRAGAGRGRQDATQDMFGLFGPATKAKIDQVNNGPDADPVTEPSTPAAAAAQPQPNDTPRTVAARVSAAMAGDFENARASAVPNMGADIKGSARHKAMAWSGLKDAEANGTAEAIVKRDELLKHDPSNLSSILKPSNFLGVLTSHLTMQAFPKEVHNYGQYASDTAEHVSTPAKLREQYYEAFKEIKQLTEELASTELDPRKINSEVNNKLQELIGKYRGKGLGTVKPLKTALGRELRADLDRFNPVANSLVNMQQRVLGRGANSILGKVNDFGKRLNNASELNADDKDKITGYVADILEGKSFNQAFNTVEKKEKGFDYGSAYGEEIIRTGGKKINMNEQSTDRPGSKVFMDDMKVRGVQFGNSLPDRERVYHAEKSAEALSDLTDILGLPDEAAGLGGKLGLAIGARGRQGAKAHFEPWQADDSANPSAGGPVINLTRGSGAGSLAHEWGHGLDHYAANNKPGAQRQRFLTEADNDNVAPLTSKAMKSVQEAMQSSGFNERLKDASNAEGISHKEYIYWSSSKEKFARTFERHVQNKLHEAGRENTYLTGLHKQGHPLWPTNDEMAHMAPHMDALIAAIAAEKFPGHTRPTAAPRAPAPAAAPAAPKEEKPATAAPAPHKFIRRRDWKDADQVPPDDLVKKHGWSWTGTDDKGNQWKNGRFIGEEGTYKESVIPTDPHAAKIKLIQAIIARRGIKPPQPKAAAKKIPEASEDADPRVKRIRELMAAYC